MNIVFIVLFINSVQFNNKQTDLSIDPMNNQKLSQQQNTSISNSSQQQPSSLTFTSTQYKPQYTLLSDIGSTHIQFQLVLIKPPLDEPLEQVKRASQLVKDYDNYQQAIKYFLIDVPVDKYPVLAVVAVAGPVQGNTVKLCNVAKWEQLDSGKLEAELKIKDFVFLNDCLAYSYGLLLCKQDNFLSLNGKEVNPKQTRGVLSVGVGLGNSIIYPAPFRKRERFYVLPGEFGHCDTPYINSTTQQYMKFLAQKMGRNYAVHEYTFCGSAIPHMYQFFALKNPQYQPIIKNPTGQQIIESYLQNRQSQPITLQKLTVQHFIQLYCNAACNYIIARMCTGGVYLVGNMTLAVVDLLKQVNITAKYLQRHPEMTKILQKVAIVASRAVDLGIKGVYVYARRIIADEQHD